MRSFREADASKAYREASANIFAMAAYALGLEADELCATHIYERAPGRNQWGNKRPIPRYRKAAFINIDCRQIVLLAPGGAGRRVSKDLRAGRARGGGPRLPNE